MSTQQPEALRLVEQYDYGEPVAWRWKPSDIFNDYVVSADPAKAEKSRQLGRDVEPLYTQPTPQAVVEPLTDEQIVGVMHSIPINAAPSHHIAFARAIEQAHGIGTEKGDGHA